MNSLISVLRKDKRVLKLKRTFDSVPYFNLPYETLIEEIENIHEVRKVRVLKAKENSIDKIIQANIQDQSFRSRLVEISMNALKAQRRLDSAITSLTNYILIEYSENLKVVKTKEERMRLLSISLEPFNRYLKRMNEIKEQADMVIHDIDKAAYSLKLTVDALKVSTQKETYI